MQEEAETFVIMANSLSEPQSVLLESVMDDGLDRVSDEQLVEAAQTGDTKALECLFDRYQDFIRRKSRFYLACGINLEDLIQEGMIGLYESIRGYRAGGAPFNAFAKLCITRQLLQAVKSYYRRKNILINSALSLDAPLRTQDSEERTLMDIVRDCRVPTPEEMVIIRERYADIEDFKDLSDFITRVVEKFNGILTELERQVLALFIAGYSYQEIAARIGCGNKTVDNALQRAKRKIVGYFRKIDKANE